MDNGKGRSKGKSKGRAKVRARAKGTDFAFVPVLVTNIC
jgi:hypothetical protein